MASTVTLIPRRWRRTAAACVAVAATAVNALAFVHARALTRFAAGGERTPRPEALSGAGKLRVLLTGATIPKPRDLFGPADAGLAAETRRFPGAFGLPLEAWLTRHPAPRGLVLLFHGYTDSKAALLPEARAFHELGYSTLLVDFHGSGGSAGAATSIGWHEARDVAAALAHVAGEPGPRVLFGTSMGAAAVLKALAEGGLRAHAAVLESPFDRLATTLSHRFEAMGVPAFPLAHLLLFWGGVQQGFDPFAHDPVDYAARVELPVLLLHGEADDRVTLAEARAIAARLRGPRELVVAPRAHHGSLLSQAPVLWRESVSHFLARHVGGG